MGFCLAQAWPGFIPGTLLWSSEHCPEWALGTAACDLRNSTTKECLKHNTNLQAYFSFKGLVVCIKKRHRRTLWGNLDWRLAPWAGGPLEPAEPMTLRAAPGSEGLQGLTLCWSLDAALTSITWPRFVFESHPMIDAQGLLLAPHPELFLGMLRGSSRVLGV